VALSGRSLSNLELAILCGLANGLRSKEIALHVRRSKPTVEGYVKQLCLKFDARSRAELVAKAFCHGTLQIGFAPYDDRTMLRVVGSDAPISVNRSNGMRAQLLTRPSRSRRQPER
jgi:DNA-binding CsgD family transcriptional regulator